MFLFLLTLHFMLLHKAQFCQYAFAFRPLPSTRLAGLRSRINDSLNLPFLANLRPPDGRLASRHTTYDGRTFGLPQPHRNGAFKCFQKLYTAPCQNAHIFLLTPEP